MSEQTSKLGLRLLRIPYVRTAVKERASLSEFRGRPTARIFIGVFAVCVSFAICWPVISALGTLSIYLHRPLLVIVLGPIVWGISHCCFLFGMALSGEKYLRILARWLTRISVEKLLAGRSSSTKLVSITPLNPDYSPRRHGVTEALL